MKYLKEYEKLNFDDSDFDFEEEIDKKLIIKNKNKKLYNFLKEKNLLDKFINYIETLKYAGNIPNSERHSLYRDIESFLDNHDDEELLDYGFYWKETNEGYNFWDEIFDQWINY